MNEKLWENLSQIISKAGNFPLPASDTLFELLKILISEKQAKFLTIYKDKPSLSIDELSEKSDLDDDSLNDILNGLMSDGIVIGTTSSKGIKVYRLMSFFPGLFEYSLMKGESGEKEKKLVLLFDNYFGELSEITQKNYDNLLPIFKKFPPFSRIGHTDPEKSSKEVQINYKFEKKKDIVLSSGDVLNLIDLHDHIALSTCYCRHEKELLNDPCKKNAPKENCFTFGKTANFAIQNNFAKAVSKDDAKKIFKEADEYGLVHKIFHVHQDISKDIEAICNCCNCCCGIFQFYKRGVMAYHTHTSLTAKVNADDCTGCNKCVEMCPMETIQLEDEIAIVGEDKCIGCGVCANNCSFDSIYMENTGPRKVFVPPRKI